MSEPDNGIEHIDHKDAPELLKRLAEHAGGTITEVGRLPDGSGFATMSMPLPKNHWSLVDPEKPNEPPAILRMGTKYKISVYIDGIEGQGSQDFIRLSREEFANILRSAGQYAYRCATMNGKEPDLDPDALLQNLVVGLLGVWTEDGKSRL